MKKDNFFIPHPSSLLRPKGKVLFEGLPNLEDVRAARFQVVVPTSQETGATWRYTGAEPAENWFRSDFDDSTWQSGTAPFGSTGYPGARTRWNTPRIWARCEFVLPEKRLTDPHLLIFNDDNATVYVNDVLAVQGLAHVRAGYHRVRIPPDVAAVLRPGKNRLAVPCRNTGGAGFLDVGLVDGTTAPVPVLAARIGDSAAGGTTVANAFWRTEGQELVQPTHVRHARLFFGEASWTDYDFSAEVLKVSGPDGLSFLVAATDEHHFREAVFGGWSNTRSVFRRVEYVREPAKGQQLAREYEKETELTAPTRTTLFGHRWHRLRVHVRGRQYRGFLDDELVFTHLDDKPGQGAVGFNTWSAFRFRNITVKSPAGKVLFAGPPKLPAPADAPGGDVPISGPKAPGVGNLDRVMCTALQHPDRQAATLAVGHEGRLRRKG